MGSMMGSTAGSASGTSLAGRIGNMGALGSQLQQNSQPRPTQPAGSSSSSGQPYTAQNMMQDIATIKQALGISGTPNTQPGMPQLPPLQPFSLTGGDPTNSGAGGAGPSSQLLQQYLNAPPKQFAG